MTWAWRHRSIRTRLGLAHAASMSVVLVAFATASYLLLWNQLEAGLRRELGREFEAVESSINVAPDGRARWLGDDLEDEAEYEGEPIAAVVWDSAGKLLVRTRAADRWGEPADTPSLDRSSEGFAAVQIRGEHVLVLQGLHMVSGRPFLVRVLRSSRPIRETMATFASVLLVAFLVALIITITTSRQLVTRLFLRPLSNMAERAARISAEQPGERLSIENPNDELGQLAMVINGTLSRFDEVAARLRRFTADASHELRTPLTSIRTVSEIALREEQSKESYRDVIGSILEEVDALTRLMDSLLLLSRADAEKSTLNRRSLSILEIVAKAEEVMSVLAERRGQSILVCGSRHVFANVDDAVLRLALINLLDNAIKYGPEGGTIELEISQDADGVQIDVHDEGAGIDAEHQGLIFDRFYRIDQGRSRSIGGNGLGLSLARWAIEAHDGTLTVDDACPRGTNFRIRIPEAKKG